MSNNAKRRKLNTPDATASVDPNPDKVVKAFLVGYCPIRMSPVFAEAVTQDDGTRSLPIMNDSRESLRFVGPKGYEEDNYIPITATCYVGAITEIKKYLYDFDVAWAPQGVDKSQLTRHRDRKGPVEEALEQFFRSMGARPEMTRALALCSS